MKATDDLKDEHRLIEVVLRALDHMARQLEMGRPLNRDHAERAVEILRSFADKCHHAKEEKHLFPLLEARGVPHEGGPISALLHDHEEGRAHVRALGRSLVGACEGDPQATPTFARHAHAYVSLLRAHIQKEDDVLFPLADQRLTPDDDAALVSAFQQIERDEIGDGVHDKYHRWAHDLADHGD